MLTVITKSEKETKTVAKMFAGELLAGLRPGKSSATVVALIGNLGTGKTTFTQGFAEGLGVKEKIYSPTFVLLKQYKLHKHRISKSYKLKAISCYKYFYHIDCYRLKNEKDAQTIGLKEILKNPENLVLIEWAERIKKILPKKNLLKVKFFHPVTPRQFKRRDRRGIAPRNDKLRSNGVHINEKKRKIIFN